MQIQDKQENIKHLCISKSATKERAILIDKKLV
jgi:hypothetical protein